MTFLDSVRTHTATLWERSGVDSAGDPEFDSPTIILVRWEQKEVIFHGSDGSEARASHAVHLGQDVDVGDYLYLGTSTQASPKDQAGAISIKDFTRIEAFDDDAVSRRALL